MTQGSKWQHVADAVCKDLDRYGEECGEENGDYRSHEVVGFGAKVEEVFVGVW